MQFEISKKITSKTIELKQNITQQSECKKNLRCFEMPYNEFMINGNFNDGNTMFRNVAKISLDAFDAYCDAQINKMTLNNISDITIKLQNKHDIAKFCLNYSHFSAFFRFYSCSHNPLPSTFALKKNLHLIIYNICTHENMSLPEKS